MADYAAKLRSITGRGDGGFPRGRMPARLSHPRPVPNVCSATVNAVRRAIGLALAALVLGGILFALSSGSAQAQSNTDYDTDNDGLIEVSNPARLNAIPWTRVCIKCKEKQQG